MQKFLLLFLLLIIFISNSLKAEFYSTISAGTTYVDDVKMDVNDNVSFTGNPTIQTTEEKIQMGLVSATVTTTQTTSYQVALKKLVFASQRKYNLAASGILGYRFNNNIRLESEYRFIDFKTKLAGGVVSANVHIDVDVSIKTPIGTLPGFHQEQDIKDLPMSLEELLNGSGSDFLPAGDGTIPAVGFRHNAHMHFLNLMYDTNITKNFGLFGGAGFGYGFLAFYDVEYPEDTEVTIYPSKSRYLAYQYKIGTFYKVSKNIDFLISYTDIKSINNVDIGAFTYQPLAFQVVEFGIRYNFI